VRSSVNRESEMEAQATLRRERARHEAATVQVHHQDLAEATDLALRLMGLFVDDSDYRRDERTGGLRVRLTKYRVS